ncbi:unnamed protein product [Cochlearia groenlandica]
MRFQFGNSGKKKKITPRSPSIVVSEANIIDGEVAMEGEVVKEREDAVEGEATMEREASMEGETTTTMEKEATTMMEGKTTMERESSMEQFSLIDEDAREEDAIEEDIETIVVPRYDCHLGDEGNENYSGKRSDADSGNDIWNDDSIPNLYH